MLVAGVAGCRDEGAQARQVPAAIEAPTEEAPAEEATATPDAGPKRSPTAACPDWSKQDLSHLPPLPASPYRELLEEVWRRVLEKYYDPTLGCLDWPAKRLEYGKAVAEAGSRAEAYQAINRMLGELEQSHFQLIAPGADEDMARGPAVPPMQVRWIDDPSGGQLVVVSSRATGHLGPVPAGAELVAIEDEPVAKLVERIRAREPEGSPFAFAMARAAMAALSCDRPGLSRRVTITDPTRNDRRVVRIVECKTPPGELVTLGNLEDIPTRVEHRIIKGTKVGYLAFNIWMLPMIRRVESAMADLRIQGMHALVLDLRGNPGGVGPMSVPVARLLLSKSGNLGRLTFRDFTQQFNVEPAEDPFTGPVAILVDEGTASTSEIFAAGMRDLGRVTIFGSRPSAGAALPSVIEALEGGALLQYVVGDYHSPRGTVVEGRGIVPDILVPETRADFAAGRDPVLEAAVEHLRDPQPKDD